METGCLKTLLIRADATAQSGAGHLLRCLALASAWQADGGRVFFLSYCDNASLRQRLEAAGFDFLAIEKPHPDPADLQATLALLQEYRAGWLALDGYHFDPAYQKAVRQAGCRLLVIDDNAHLPRYHADLLLNQNIHAETLAYPCDPATELLLGTRYALLRPEFLPWRGWQRQIPPVARKALVTLGGGDSREATAKVIQALNLLKIENLEAIIVSGSHHPSPQYPGPQSPDPKSPNPHSLTSVQNMPELMAWADLAVSAGGSTCWELAFMGLPNLILVLAENQRLVAGGLAKAGVSVNLGWHEKVTPADIADALQCLALSSEVRAESSRRGRELVDGDGAHRLMRQMAIHSLSLRPVQENDVRLVWEWANDPLTRSVSFSTRKIPWEEHVKWFSGKLAEPNCRFFIALDAAGSPAGQVRYQIEGEQAVVSVSLAPEQRGKGYGSYILKLSAQRIFTETPVTLIHAYIKPDNTASIGAFAKAGYVKSGVTEIMGSPALDYTLRKLPGDKED